MPQVTNKKNRDPHGVGFDGLDVLAFPSVTLAASQANTVVQAITLAPTTYKFLRLMCYLSGAVAGTCSVNVIAGIAAEAGTGIPDTLDNGVNAYPRVVAGAGIQLLTADTALTMTTNTVTQIDLPADLFDVIWKGALTLRTATSAGCTGTLYAALLGKQTDINPSRPQGSGTDVNFTPANDIP
jgi:hypothetical protein